MTVSVTNTVRDLAVGIPGATRIFEQLGIDYCCGGGKTLADACDRVHVPIEQVVSELESATQSKESAAADWQTKSLTDLSAHIVDTHHFFTKQELIRLERLLDKVCSRHAQNHPELDSLREIFSQLKQDLIPHMLREEQVLFPYIARMEEAVTNHREIPPPFFGTVQNPVRMMATEHDTAGDLLRELRQISGNYLPPPDACISYQTLYQALAELEADLHQHIHLENNILFPRAVQMEGEAKSDWQTVASHHQCFGH
ncbi:MAG: iron-sulfur cluster repair di-iron protein [Acidobacteria bacterium]|nr:iron-sulfur cluster repair di-iron protein [Acidobacteriota bacterium]